ncbi:PAS domain-containing protein [Streptomyces polyrhachis]|uniref:PAS domain-containing protein n=1 Tax=Streptomyces polyrhachis TaxID=1282885 RepID=A0ABW2GB15_9ACTN
MSSRPSRGAARLAAILDALPDALLLVNTNGTVVAANPVALETFESPGTGLVGRGVLDLLPDFDPKLIPGSMRRPEVEHEGRTPPTRMTARRTDGETFTAEVTSKNLEDGQSPYAGEPQYTGDELLMLVVRDLTGTLDTEAELARQRRQTEMILRAAAEGVIGVDAEGRIVLVNPAAAQILGYRAGELGGAELHPLIHHSRPDGAELPFDETPLADTLRSGRKHRVRGQVLWSKDGRPVPVDLTTAPVRDGEQLVGAVLAFTDRRAADALAAREAQLRAVLDEGLRGPLEQLRGELSTLAADSAGQLWPEANQVLHHLAAGYGRMTTLIDSVLGYQRVDAGREKLRLGDASLDAVVNDAVERSVELIGPGRAQFVVHAPAIPVRVDADRLAQALAHLVADVAGVDATGRAPATGGSGDSTIVVAAAQRGEVVRIEVRGPFSGGNPVHEPLARGIVRLHGGVLQTHEVPGAGAGAYVLEVPAGGAAAPGAAVADRQPASGGETTVLPAPVEHRRGALVADPGAGEERPGGRRRRTASAETGELVLPETAPGGPESPGGRRRRGGEASGPIALPAAAAVPEQAAPEAVTPPQARPAQSIVSEQPASPAGGTPPHGIVVDTPPHGVPGGTSGGRRRRAVGTGPAGAAQPEAPQAQMPAQAQASAPVPAEAPQPSGRRRRAESGPEPVPAGAALPHGMGEQVRAQGGPQADWWDEDPANSAAALDQQGPGRAEAAPAEPVAAGRRARRALATDVAERRVPEQGSTPQASEARAPIALGPVEGPAESPAPAAAQPVQPQGPTVSGEAVQAAPPQPVAAEAKAEPQPRPEEEADASGARRFARAVPRPTPPPLPQTQPGSISVRTLGHGVPVLGRLAGPQAQPAADPGAGRRRLGTPPHGTPVPQTPSQGGRPQPGESAEHSRRRDAIGRAFSIETRPGHGPGDPAPEEGPEPLDAPHGVVEVAPESSAPPVPLDDELPPEPLDNPRRLLVWPEPDESTREALTARGYRPVVVHSREEVDAQLEAYPAALFVDPLTGPITRTALQSLRTAAVSASVPVLVTAGLGQATREAAYGADPAVLLKALAPRDSEQHPPRVLLFEENPDIQAAMTAALERRGMQVGYAAQDEEAVELAARMHPNLVVMDLMQVRRRRAGLVDWLSANGLLARTPMVVYTAADLDPHELPRLRSGETVLFLAERSTSTEVQSRIVDLLAKIGTS